MATKAARKPVIFGFSSKPTEGIFSTLSDAESKALLRGARSRSLSRGAYLVRAKAPADNFFIVLEGQLEVSRTTVRGKSIVLNRIGPGDVVGEVSALGGVPRTADVVCRTDCLVAEISVSEFRRRLAEVPNFAAFIMKAMALRLSHSTYKLFDIATEDIPSRVLHALRALEPQTASLHENYYLIRERPTHAELARLVGTSREVISRALSLLEQAGEIQQEGKSIFVRA